MKTNKIVMIAALATLAIGCSTEDNEARHLRIFSENMNGGHNTKVLVDPANVNATTWVADETIDLNGQEYTITQYGDGGFGLLNSVPLDEDMYAVYPANSQSDDIDVENNNGTGSVVLDRLTIDFMGENHMVIFPMMATATANSENLLFRHLTAGFKMKLQNSTEDDITVTAVKIIAGSTTNAASIAALDGYSACWAKQGTTPSLPDGEVGEIGGDWNVNSASVMEFDVKTDGIAGATIEADDDLSFCVPVTISSVRYLTIELYNGNTLVKRVNKDLGNETAISRNVMYNIPAINITE
jgi:hypothetical protein